MENVGQRQSQFVVGLFLLVFGLALLLFGRLLFTYITAIVLALVLASLFWGVYEWLRAKFGGRDKIAAGVTTLVVVLVVIVPIAGVLAALSAQAFALYERLSNDNTLLVTLQGLVTGESHLGQQARELFARVGVDLSPDRLASYAQDSAKAAGLFLYEQISGIASNVFGLILHFSMMLIFLFAFFTDGQRLKAYILDLSPLPDEEEEELSLRFSSISRAVFLGNGLASLLQGVAGGVSFYLFGIGSGILWGAAIAFFAFLPAVGASIVLIPAAIWLFTQGETGMAIGFLAFNAVQVAILEYGVKTRLIGGKSQLNGVLVFFGIVAGLSVFGLLGIFYGPLIITMFLTLAEIYKEHYRDNLIKIVRLELATHPPEDQDVPPPAPEDLAPVP